MRERASLEETASMLQVKLICHCHAPSCAVKLCNPLNINKEVFAQIKHYTLTG